MLERPTEKELDALASLHGPNWETVRGWLQRSFDGLSKACRTTLDEPILRQQQGAATVLDEFLDRQAKSATALASRRNK